MPTPQTLNSVEVTPWTGVNPVVFAGTIVAAHYGTGCIGNICPRVSYCAILAVERCRTVSEPILGYATLNQPP